MTAGQLMREARLRAGLSQSELGNRISRPAPQIARWERGEVDPGFAVVQKVLRACGFDIDERLVFWQDEYRVRLDENLRRSPADRFARALRRCAKAGMDGDPRRILGELEKARVVYCLIGGLAASIRGADRLSIGVDILPSMDVHNMERMSAALIGLGVEPIGSQLLSRLDGVSSVQTPHGLLCVVDQPLGTMGFDGDMRRVVEREHLGRGPEALEPMSLQPLVASTPDLVRMTSASTTGRDERLVELRRLAELEVKQRR
jgi:transcriptional regulator with XRE-family HTH domain